MTEGTCQRTVVAQGPCTELARCSCGHMHLTVGPLTLRLDETALTALFLMLREGMPRLAVAAQGPAAVGQAGGWKQ